MSFASIWLHLLGNYFEVLLTAGEYESERIGQKFSSNLAQESMGLFFADVAGAYCQDKTKRKRREDIQNADHRDAGESRYYLVAVQLAIHVLGIESVAETCRRQCDVADFQRDSEQLENDGHRAQQEAQDDEAYGTSRVMPSPIGELRRPL